MLKSLKNRKAQAVMGEYVVVIFLAVSVVTGMMFYFQRAIQARIRDAREYMVTEVRARTEGSFEGNLYREYEPYYANTVAIVSRNMNDESRLLGGGSSGIFQKYYNETTSVSSNSETAPPRDHELTTPVN